MTDLGSVIFTPYGNLIRLLCVLCFAGATVALIIAIRQRKSRAVICLAAAHFALNFFFLVTVLDGTYGEEFFPQPRKWFAFVTLLYKAPWLTAVFLIVLSAAVSAMLLVQAFRYARRTVSQAAVKESVDLLPTGICFGNREGRNEMKSRDGDSYLDALTLADTIGVTVNVTGEPPKNPTFRKLAARAVHECAVNLVKHAGGDTLYVDFSDNSATFTNNGRPPDGEIAEAGGLLNLRKMTEEKGGRMIIRSAPEFALRLEF